MRILHVIQAFYPCRIWGGPPQNTYVLARNMRDRGHDVEILTTNIVDHRERLSKSTAQRDWEGIPVTYLKAYWIARRANSMGAILAPDVWRYRSLIKQADVVHIHGYRHFLFSSAAKLARRYGVPFVVHARGALPANLGRSRWKRIYDSLVGRRLMRHAAGAVALNDQEIDDYAALGVARQKICKILNPWDPSVCDPLPERHVFRRKFGYSEDDKLVLFLARIHEKKGLELLLRAVDALKVPNVKLCVVGPDDGYQARAQALARDLGIEERTAFVGPLHGAEKFAAYRAADVYVLPTRGFEGLPTTILEACYAETPVIVTRTTEVAQLVDGIVGTAIDYNVEQLASSLQRTLSGSEFANRCRANASRWLSQHFGLAETMDRFESLYQLLSSENQTGKQFRCAA